MKANPLRFRYLNSMLSAFLILGAVHAVAETALPDTPSVNRTSVSSSAQPLDDRPGTSFFSTFRSYDAAIQLGPQTPREKLAVGISSSFGPSGILFSGAKAGLGQASNTYPAFRQGAQGYGRYYWHAFADQAVENITVQSLLPIALKQDSRYYGLGHGGIARRTGYALSRVLITRTDGQRQTFNASEVIGAGAAAGISTAYYPDQYRTWTKTGQRWLSNVLVDGGFMVVREFWPDVSRKLFRRN
ncbi:hypothetical protein [Terriglobus saanensis]|uniref:Lipoprotein n=1 Tax=Terriglobus saanensis (strain ATCC BAA-1853 / DSM 23119 / SP1PR4) TaxID=401053 RepID=E8V462_TERSS|nr:hypothetical protein [Terriglobus saanensis]ADV82553.1 hypothetical protein AciPR4_1746 [Terriglobus saanensis SP1PR4]